MKAVGITTTQLNAASDNDDMMHRIVQYCANVVCIKIDNPFWIYLNSTPLTPFAQSFLFKKEVSTIGELALLKESDIRSWHPDLVQQVVDVLDQYEYQLFDEYDIAASSEVLEYRYGSLGAIAVQFMLKEYPYSARMLSEGYYSILSDLKTPQSAPAALPWRTLCPDEAIEILEAFLVLLDDEEPPPILAW